MRSFFFGGKSKVSKKIITSHKLSFFKDITNSHLKNTSGRKIIIHFKYNIPKNFIVYLKIFYLIKSLKIKVLMENRAFYD